jgi:hypothetical protein
MYLSKFKLIPDLFLDKVVKYIELVGLVGYQKAIRNVHSKHGQ